jgi:multidrug resistance efflux pump
MRARIFLTAAAVLLLAAGAAVYLRARRAPPKAAPASALRPPDELVFPAVVRAQHVVPVAAPADGIIESLLVEVGEQAYEGQLLGRVKNETFSSGEQSAAADLERAQERGAELQDQLISLRIEASRIRGEAARARAGLDRAERDWRRQQMLLKEGATPRLVYEKSLREYEAARASHDAAEQLARAADDRLASVVRAHDAARKLAAEKSQALDDARLRSATAEIHAPVSGLVVGRSVKAGDEVTLDVKNLFEIATDTTALEAVATPDAATVARLRPGVAAFVSTPDAPERIAGRVAEIRSSGQVIVTFTAPESVRPGSAAQLRIKTP